MFVLGQNLFLKAHSFPQAFLSKSYSHLRTNNACGQISVHIFAPNGGYCLYVSAKTSVLTLQPIFHP